MTSNSGIRRLWRPSADTLETIAAALGAHWRAAATRPTRLFRSTPVSWLKSRRASLTSEPAAASSSDTLPDPHPY